ncbi:hypothetical protein CBP36_21320 (plasmid) [Acidovorax carolinensis]|uniref:CN hydrolase domain-containing protein n=1 Tax=Acidovorax carolinensis TaxID=553814 RepID=A0A240UKG1_9BURK|nr:hypothetical protein CBP36_21320 [Acidovorax carolinensis]
MLRIFFTVTAGAGIGAFAWGRSESIDSLAILLALPGLWRLLKSRSEAFTLMLAYYLAGARDLSNDVSVFFGNAAPQGTGMVMWIGASILLSLPFALFWSVKPTQRAFGFLLAVLVCIPPPLGIIGWLNPLTVAGVIFPGAGWVGLAMTLILFVALASCNRALLMPLVTAAVISNGFATSSAARTPENWQGFDTSFEGLASGGMDRASQYLSAMQRTEWLNNVIADMPSGVTLVLPETILGRYDGVVKMLLGEADAILRAKGSRVLVGAELPLATGQYKNSVLVLGATQDDGQVASQGIPVPAGMWKPWAEDGAKADFLARENTIIVDGRRIGASICYEQLLAYSLLRLMVDKPEIITAVSNVWWAKSGSIPKIQSQSVHAFATLFSVPVVAARNF